MIRPNLPVTHPLKVIVNPPHLILLDLWFVLTATPLLPRFGEEMLMETPFATPVDYITNYTMSIAPSP